MKYLRNNDENKNDEKRNDENIIKRITKIFNWWRQSTNVDRNDDDNNFKNDEIRTSKWLRWDDEFQS